MAIAVRLITLWSSSKQQHDVALSWDKPVLQQGQSEEEAELLVLWVCGPVCGPGNPHPYWGGSGTGPQFGAENKHTPIQNYHKKPDESLTGS